MEANANASKAKILFESTKSFEKELKRLDNVDRKRVINKVNSCAQWLSKGSHIFNQNLYTLPLPFGINGYELSLYILRVSSRLRIVLTLDEDPIFEQIIITLFRVTSADNLEQEYCNIAKSLYQDFLCREHDPVGVM
ncbi:MAG: hypothetical protein AAGG51_24530 [Cyanobacteria bacterium P01_G01_bin.54]